MNDNWLILIVGPTAVGKTSLSIKLAQHFNTEIISADSRQFFKELTIGTAKPSLNELAQVKHHCINNKNISDYYSAGDFERDANQILETHIFTKSNLAIAVGGSGLYTKALMHGLDDMPEIDNELRNSLINLYQQEGIVPLQKKLLALNPEKYAQIDSNNHQRIMRAIELSVQEVELGNNKKPKPYNVLTIGLNLNREKLYEQINTRVDAMMEEGLVNEVKELTNYKELNALKTVGYAELFDYFDDKYTLEQAVDKIKQHTRNYAKKQITWFNKQENITWFEPTELDKIAQFIAEKTAITK